MWTLSSWLGLAPGPQLSDLIKVIFTAPITELCLHTGSRLSLANQNHVSHLPMFRNSQSALGPGHQAWVESRQKVQKWGNSSRPWYGSLSTDWPWVPGYGLGPLWVSLTCLSCCRDWRYNYHSLLVAVDRVFDGAGRENSCLSMDLGWWEANPGGGGDVEDRREHRARFSRPRTDAWVEAGYLKSFRSHFLFIT